MSIDQSLLMSLDDRVRTLEVKKAKQQIRTSIFGWVAAAAATVFGVAGWVRAPAVAVAAVETQLEGMVTDEAERLARVAAQDLIDEVQLEFEADTQQVVDAATAAARLAASKAVEDEASDLVRQWATSAAEGAAARHAETIATRVTLDVAGDVVNQTLTRMIAVAEAIVGSTVPPLVRAETNRIAGPIAREAALAELAGTTTATLRAAIDDHAIAASAAADRIREIENDLASRLPVSNTLQMRDEHYRADHDRVPTWSRDPFGRVQLQGQINVTIGPEELSPSAFKLAQRPIAMLPKESRPPQDMSFIVIARSKRLLHWGERPDNQLSWLPIRMDMYTDGAIRFISRESVSNDELSILLDSVSFRTR